LAAVKIISLIAQYETIFKTVLFLIFSVHLNITYFTLTIIARTP